MRLEDLKITATIKEEVKEELGNGGGFYDGEFTVTALDQIEKIATLSNSRITIFRNFDEIDVKLEVIARKIEVSKVPKMKPSEIMEELNDPEEPFTPIDKILKEGINKSSVYSVKSRKKER